MSAETERPSSPESVAQVMLLKKAKRAKRYLEREVSKSTWREKELLAIPREADDIVRRNEAGLTELFLTNLGKRAEKLITVTGGKSIGTMDDGSYAYVVDGGSKVPVVLGDAVLNFDGGNTYPPDDLKPLRFGRNLPRRVTPEGMVRVDFDVHDARRCPLRCDCMSPQMLFDVWKLNVMEIVRYLLAASRRDDITAAAICERFAALDMRMHAEYAKMILTAALLLVPAGEELFPEGQTETGGEEHPVSWDKLFESVRGMPPVPGTLGGIPDVFVTGGTGTGKTSSIRFASRFLGNRV